ncbi:MAG TPA: trypsin-like peptidase domain-containing protein, partial [Pyrinomonadaceae bacterium]|nr:trypsin-like peptidase domain-containing protein [Pyrinomonadaceae bacterium]
MQRRIFSILIILVAAAAGLPALVYSQDLLPALVRRVKPSAVAIETFDQRGQIVSRGSGFFVSADRVVTNRHVIERSTRAEIQTVDGRKFRVSGVLAIDGEGDLAMLQVEVPAGVAVPLPLTRFVPQGGESIVGGGNPFGLEGSGSNGIV